MGSNQPPLTEHDIPQLLQLLQGALSADASTQKQAEAVLASIESRIGYCSCLAVGGWFFDIATATILQVRSLK